MRDTTLLSTDAAVAASALATTEMNIGKTAHDGVWLQFRITRNDADADETLDISVHGKNGSGVASTDDKVAVIPQIANGDVANGDSIIREVLVQTDFTYINAYYTVGGTTPSWDVEFAVVSGPSTGQVG